ncbi:hypothetical protein BG011_006820 [Mortierella polycephala]|uniref:Argonaute-like protein n=1 Tax=Mortierella polycephala TaxID=41804 RepID=A0A9P6PV94_9FUNG|nr:hypothetical protein BG011_006820 [Mortierella polycephala]
MESSPDFMTSGVKVAFDGRCNAFAPAQLKFVGENGYAVDIEYQDAGGPPKKPDAKKNIFRLKMILVATIDLGELHQFLHRKGPFTSNCATAIQALNVALTHKPFSEKVSVGRSIYIPDGARDLGGGLEKWNGIFQSIRPGQGRCYVNIDTTATAFIKGGQAVGVFEQILKTRLHRDHPLRDNERSMIERVLKGTFFTVTHRGVNQRKFKLERISDAGADRTYFDMVTNDGRTKSLSVREYYKEAYGTPLNYPSLPCFGVRHKENTSFFPAEMCYIVPGQHYKKKLNEEQVATMIKETAVKPDQRARNIQGHLRVLDFANNAHVKAFGINIAPEMSVVPARILPSPIIEYQGGYQTQPQQGTWQPNRHQIGSRLSSWAVLVFENEHRARRDRIENFVRMLVQVLRSSGVDVTCARPPIVYGQVHGNFKPDIDHARRAAKKECDKDIELLLVILPGKGQLYGAIKAYCEIGGDGLMTQCLLWNKVSKANDQYCRLLGLKINTKLGGTVSTLARGTMPVMDKGRTLILGADVTHPSPGEGDKPSIASVVASWDDHGYKYVGRCQMQNSQVEVIEHFQRLVVELIRTYKQLTKHHPQRIIVYRDGVSEGQFPEIQRTEIPMIQAACRSLDPKYLPPITFIVVKKRHHARFFPNPNSNSPRDRSGNCVAGTVIDTTITHPTEFDFYLQSHAGLQGTSRSTLYHVLVDQNKFTSDALQKLTYNLCHLYSRCPRTLSIVPAVQYAHMLAFRARYYSDFGYGSDRGRGDAPPSEDRFQRIDISEELKDKMFFV